MDRLPCGVLQVSTDRRILYSNQYASRMLGVSSDSVSGQRLESALSAASRIFMDSYVYPLLLNNSVAEELQLVLLSQAGRKISVVVSIVMEADGSFLWTFMTCNNRDKLYEELLSARDTLSEKAHELTGLNDKVQSENEDLQVFCRSLSHDFKAPIRRAQQAIFLVTEDLRSRNMDVEDELEMLDHVADSMNSVLTLINGLLEFLIADAYLMENDIVDLNGVIIEAISLNEGQSKHPISVSREPLPSVSGSAAQLQVLFKNLIANAIKYTEEPPEIHITCDSDMRKGFFTIAIKDNGIGMSSDHLAKIFEPFARIQTDGHYTGSGLGLSIVKKLIARHHGDISVQSSPGNGSTFFVSFPVPQQVDESL